MATKQFESPTTAVDCPDCARRAEAQIQRIRGVSSARFDFLNRRLKLSFDDDLIETEQLRQEIEKLGHFKLEDRRQRGERRFPVSRRLLFGTLFSLLLAIAAIAADSAVSAAVAANLLFYLAILVGGWDIFNKAVVALRHRQIDMNVLMSLAVIGAVVIGEFHEAVVVVLLFGFANMLESYSLWRLSRNLTDLSSFTSGHALMKVGDEIRHVAPEELRPDDIVVIREGMRLPADGMVVAGSSFVDVSVLTGESAPQAVSPGSKVYAGAINREGYLEVEVTATSDGSEIGKILKLVAEASAGRSQIERIVDRFARVYTPIVVGLALLVAVVPPLLAEQPVAEWFYKALIFLVIACPCALVISTPVAISTALASASRLKAVFRSGEGVERLAAARQIAFDKTGTLTLGSLKLEQITPLAGRTAAEVLQLAHSLEQASNHPYARAIRRSAIENGTSVLPVRSLAAVSGVGVQGEIDGRRYTLGRPRNLDDEESELLEQDHAVFLSDNELLIGVLTFSEEIRPEAIDTLQHLRRFGYRPIGMLSGDRQEQTDRIAGLLKLEYARGSLSPQQKFEILRQMEEPVVMIGDGINDAVALSGAFVSIAVARFGVDLASQQADVTLFGDTISALPKLMALAKRAVRTIKVNIAFAFAVKLLFLALALFGYANIWMAVAADMGASLLVIGNSLRLLRER